MYLKNEAARLITISHLVGKTVTKYQILPGENPAVEVPDEVSKIDFVKALLKNGSLRRVSEDELNGVEEDEQTLAEQAAALGIKVDNRWSKETLREEIAKAQK